MQTIGIREPCPDDRAELESLINDHFSEDASYEVDLGLDDPTYHVRVAEHGDGTLLGVLAVEIFSDPAAVIDSMYFFDEPELLPSATQYGHLQMGYVRSDATGNGVGSRLLDHIHEIGKEHGVELFAADAWYHGGPDSPEGLFEKYDYDVIYRDPIDRPAEECPKCTTTCTCEAALPVSRVE